MTTFSKKSAITCMLAGALVLGLTACGSTSYNRGSSGGEDINSRMNALENRVNTLSNQVDGTQAADVWNKMQTMENDLKVVRNQMNDLDTRMSGPKGNQVMSANERLDRLEMAMRQMASQLGVKVEALDQPLTTPQTQAPAYDNYNPDPYAQPGQTAPVQTGQTGQAGQMSGAADPYQQNMQQPAVNPDGTVTVLINGEPRQVPVNPQAAQASAQQNAQAVSQGSQGELASPLNAPASSAASAGGDIAQTLYDDGLEYFNKRQYKEALKCFQDFSANYGTHRLAGNSLFWQGECSYQLSDYPAAVLAYQKVITDYPKNDKYVSSLLKQGMALSSSGNKDAAKVRWREIVNKYPNSPEAARAKKLLAGGK